MSRQDSIVAFLIGITILAVAASVLLALASPKRGRK